MQCAKSTLHRFQETLNNYAGSAIALLNEEADSYEI